MKSLPTKHQSIRTIYNDIEKLAGQAYFEEPDFWEGDLCAIGLHKNNKLVYISTYNFIEYFDTDPKFFVEFEFIDPFSYKTGKIVKTFDEITREALLEETAAFFELAACSPVALV